MFVELRNGTKLGLEQEPSHTHALDCVQANRCRSIAPHMHFRLAWHMFEPTIDVCVCVPDHAVDTQGLSTSALDLVIFAGPTVVKYSVQLALFDSGVTRPSPSFLQHVLDIPARHQRIASGGLQHKLDLNLKDATLQKSVHPIVGACLHGIEQTPTTLQQVMSTRPAKDERPHRY